MCLAIPSKIERIKDDNAIIVVDGVKRKFILLPLEDAKAGDYVIVVVSV
jgi:hydrogenase assembly chaperone HypC/HupF